MRYISLFSGVGGLESAETSPSVCCEIDEACRTVLKKRFPGSELHNDVEEFSPPKADVVAGGWPCQDLSVAGQGRGLSGARSGLFFQLLRIALESKCHTIIAENVPNLIRMGQGVEFESVLNHFTKAGYPHIAWRSLNARQFGLPHHRQRVFIVASKSKATGLSLHRQIKSPRARRTTKTTRWCNAFYWTAGLQSICYKEGYTPTLKVGSSLSIPSPPAIHFRGTVRKASPDECLRLQGFDPNQFSEVAPKDIYRMAGNAVAAPVGQFVFDSVHNDNPSLDKSRMQEALGFDRFPKDGFSSRGKLFSIENETDGPLASNLIDFVDTKNKEPISPRAARGLIRRLDRSGKPCPTDLRAILESVVAETPIQPTARVVANSPVRSSAADTVSTLG